MLLKMSFLKITDPSKRDHIVEEFLKSKKNIIDSFRSERLGDIGLQRELTKLYKPITDIGKSQLAQQQAMSTALTKELGQLKAIQFPQYPSILAKTDDEVGEPEESLIKLGPIATQYMRPFASKVPTDKTFGLYDKGGKFYIGDSEVTISSDDIIIGDETFDGTHGLWELITSKNPDDNIYTKGDYENYKKNFTENWCSHGPNNWKSKV